MVAAAPGDHRPGWLSVLPPDTYRSIFNDVRAPLPAVRWTPQSPYDDYAWGLPRGEVTEDMAAFGEYLFELFHAVGKAIDRVGDRVIETDRAEPVVVRIVLLLADLRMTVSNTLLALDLEGVSGQRYWGHRIVRLSYCLDQFVVVESRLKRDHPTTDQLISIEPEIRTLVHITEDLLK